MRIVRAGQRGSHVSRVAQQRAVVVASDLEPRRRHKRRERGGINPLRPHPVAEKTCLSSRSLAFEVHPIATPSDVDGALYAFAYRYGVGWRVLYVGARAQHKVDTAIGYGATHLLVLEDGAVDETWLIDELKPLLNGS